MSKRIDELYHLHLFTEMITRSLSRNQKVLALIPAIPFRYKERAEKKVGGMVKLAEKRLSMNGIIK